MLYESFESHLKEIRQVNAQSKCQHQLTNKSRECSLHENYSTSITIDAFILWLRIQRLAGWFHLKHILCERFRDYLSNQRTKTGLIFTLHRNSS